MKFSAAYLKLCDKIYKIDQDAVFYMLFIAPHSDKVWNNIDRLDSSFSFADTPQGYKYWWNIVEKLMEIRYNE